MLAIGDPMTNRMANERLCWKLQLVFTNKVGHSGHTPIQQLVSEFCKIAGGHITTPFCKKYHDGNRASFYFEANDGEIDYLMKLVAGFVNKNDIKKMMLEKVDPALAKQKFESQDTEG
jgi:hypothetical protein